MRMLARLKDSRLHFLFNLKDEKAKGRCVMLTSSLLTSLVSILTGGLFYTSFLIANGIDLVKVGIISFVPFIANLFSVFSPSILERFEKRRWVLAGGRLAYHTLNILGIILMPMLVRDQQLKMILFVVIVFAANIVSALFSSGYTAWHLHFIPNEIRAEYFSASSAISGLLCYAFALVFSAVADAFSASPYAQTVIVILRLLGYVLALVEIAVLLSPVEYPYERSGAHPRLRDIVTKPLSHKKFMLTMLVVFLYTFGTNVPASALNYYLVNDVKVSYTLIQFLNLCYPVCMILLMRYWQRIIRRFGWLRTFAVSLLMTAPTVLAYSCVTAGNYLWLLTAVRLSQHVIMMGMNIAYSNMSFLNMPREDQTNYIAFNTITANLAAFLGMMCGTWFVGRFPSLSVTLLGRQFGSVQVLMWFEALMQVAVACLVFARYKSMTPDDSNE